MPVGTSRKRTEYKHTHANEIAETFMKRKKKQVLQRTIANGRVVFEGGLVKGCSIPEDSEAQSPAPGEKVCSELSSIWEKGFKANPL